MTARRGAIFGRSGGRRKAAIFRLCSLLSIVAVSWVPPGSGASEPAVSHAVPPGYVLPETEVWEFAAEGGKPYRIFVSWPRESTPEEGYPVLYVLDGNAIFASFAEARRLQAGTRSNAFAKPDIGNSVIVGVGYPTDLPYHARRQSDYVTPRSAEAQSGQVRSDGLHIDSRKQFLDFLLNDLRQEIMRRYPVDPRRQSLFGHSFGGLFALHVLYTRPDAFEAIIAASPSQWWNEQEILSEEHEFASRLSESELSGPVSRLLLLAGEHEERIANLQDTESLARRLEPLSAFGLHSRFEMLDNEVHVTVPSRAVTSALRFAFR